MIDTKLLIEKAFEAQKFCYTPYSNFNVGAALLGANGKIYQGCNIENAAYTPTNCAERTAFFKAISEGQKEFTAIAVVGNKEGVKQGEGDFCAPCAVCRQVMAEFCDLKTFKVIIAKSTEEYLEYTFKDRIINRIINCIEYYGINPNYESKNKVISIIEKNNIQDFIQIINILKIRDNLKGYTFDIIKNETHQNVLQRLEKSKIYISLSDEEGFGLSAAEAMAMGCVVIGYHGQGAKEYFKEEFSYRVEQGDVIDICKKVEEVIELIENRNEEYLSKVKKAREFILANYSKEQQEKSVVETWTDILTRL